MLLFCCRLCILSGVHQHLTMCLPTQCCCWVRASQVAGPAETPAAPPSSAAARACAGPAHADAVAAASQSAATPPAPRHASAAPAAAAQRPCTAICCWWWRSVAGDLQLQTWWWCWWCCWSYRSNSRAGFHKQRVGLTLCSSRVPLSL